jgi:hypothetical protein
MKNSTAVNNNHHILNLISTKDWIIAGLIFLLFFGIYFGLSRQLVQNTPIAKYDDILFEIDTARAIIDMTVFSGNHYRTEVHPIYVLLVNPFAELVGKFISPDPITAIFINALFGAAGTALAYLIFRLMRIKRFSAALFCALFGFSTSQIFLSAIPDTASLAVLTLLFTYTLFIYTLEYTTVHDWIWISAGILTLGVTTTNFAQTFILYALIQLKTDKQQNLRVTLWKIARYALIVIAITVLLALLQKWIYPSSTLFFLPEVYFSELNYASISIFDEPLRIASIVFKSFSADTIIAPNPIFFEIHGRNIIPAVTFTDSSNYMITGIVGLILWSSLLCLNLVQYLKAEKASLLTIGIVACLAFNFVLHSFYGIGEKNKIELFLYTGNITYLFILLTAGWGKITDRSYFLLIPLMAAAAINNLMVLQQIIHFLSF